MNKIVISNLSNIKKLAIHIGVLAAIAALGTAGAEINNVINTLPNVPLVYAVALSTAVADGVRLLMVELRGLDTSETPPASPPLA